MKRTGLPDPVELAEAIDALGRSTGYPLWGSRLALTQGNVAVAYRGYLEHRRLVNARIIPRIDAATSDVFDGLDPTELLRRQAALPTRADTKGPRR
ncbi:hypothetical protein [Kocuria turfanensis]|uniref:Uncharacterized protein n=1 Tax=Kocuria turfanensis TaxID=388357 RepID=A0A512IBZ1_9MICC|nr:hypothetical protein [Kocuria turfanensis]GEO95218.1 hypothetical protein KTU01_13410 [Kocuria turfanensis]